MSRFPCYNKPMTTRHAKQVIYGALYLLIFAGIVAGIYYAFFYIRPSCFDNIQNQGEAGVDCGGTCAKVCIPTNLSTISVLGNGVQVFNIFPAHSLLPIHYGLLAQVANVNAGYASPDFGYRFDLYDASGTVFQSVSGHSFLYGSEVKYLAVPNVAATAPVGHAALVIENPTWVPAGAMGLIPLFGNGRGAPLPITDVAVTSSTVTVSGALTDRDIATFTNVLVVAIFYDASGNPIGASQTVIDSITPNETRNFSVMYPWMPNINPALTKAFAYALRV